MKSVARESQILHSQNSLDIIVVSLQGFNEWRAANRVFEFIDDCILRLVRKPIRYYDDLTDLVLAANIGMNASDSNIDLLLIALLEQWPFLVKIVDPPALANVSTWLVHYIEMMWITVGRKNSVVSDGGDNKIISLIRDQMKAEINDRECKMMFSKALKDPSEFRVPDEPKLPARASEEKHITKSISDDEDVGSKSSTDLMPSGPPRESEDHPGLNSWSREDVSDAISGGSIADLILCLCSGHAEIRKQGLGNLRTFMGKLEVSDLLTSSDCSSHRLVVKI